MTNQRRVYEAEQAALQERKLTEARLEEIRRERQIEETQKQLEASGGPKRIDRVDWMYQGPNDGGRDEYSSEAFLLGKRRIDSILRGDDAKKVEKTAGPTGEAPAPLTVVASARDVASKIREDPLVAIKRQEQEAYQAMMKDPSKRRQLLAQMGIAEEPKSKERKHRDDKHRSHRHQRSHRHRDEEDDERRRRRHYSRDRSRSPRRHDDDSDYERRRKRRRSDSRDRTEARRRSDSRDDGRDRRRYDSDDDPRGSRRRIDSPERRRYDQAEDNRLRRGGYDDKRRDGSDEHNNNNNNNNNNGRNRRGYDDRHRNGYNGGSSRPRRDYPDRRPQQNGNDAEERAKKLAAMQNDATDLDKAREERLAALAEKEQTAREADDRARANAQKYGGREFANKLHNAAGSESLAARLGRGRQGLQRDED